MNIDILLETKWKTAANFDTDSGLNAKQQFFYRLGERSGVDIDLSFLRMKTKPCLGP